MEMMRLDKLLAHSGVGTRKEVKTYIRKGWVLVNQEVVKKDDFKVNPDIDEIICNDELIKYQKYIYLMLNKPAGYICANKDNVHPTVLELIDDYYNYQLFPVGRLDIDTEGLLIISNDGDFAHKLLAPSRKHSKLYYTKVEGVINQRDVDLFKQGISIDTGYKCMPSNMKLIKIDGNISEVEIEIFEGKFHQVKKMIEAVDKKVIYLKRIKIRSLCLDEDLKLGKYRELTTYELVDLMDNL